MSYTKNGKRMGRKAGPHSVELFNRICDLYYANSGTYDWRTGKGEVGAWTHSMKNILHTLGFKQYGNILDRLRRNGLPTRMALVPTSRGRTLIDGGAPAITGTTEGTEAVTPATRQLALGAQALRLQVLRQAIASPKVMLVISQVCHDQAVALGVDCPTTQEIAGYVSRIRG